MEDRPIVRLTEEVISRIAAGEVVENPASAIKELMENSLDAGATCVTVELRDGGISYFRVTDNGHGIRSRDIRMAFERHATSKISRSEDLFDLHTLGFRGEALASVAAVSKVTLTTHHESDPTGTRAVNEGGIFKEISEAGGPVGTTIVVRGLFYNTPVRLKFLKKPVTEATLASEVVARMILAHPDVSFRLTSGGKQIYSSTGNGELKSAVFCLYGRETANAMIPVHSEGAVSVQGLVGVGLQARNNRARQTFIVNGRTIRSPLLTQALEEGCRERVTIGHYPICVLNIQVPPTLLDVNVHPNKLEVRFGNEQLVYQNVSGAVKDAFSISPVESAPVMTLTKEPETPRSEPAAVRVIRTDTEEGLQKAKAASEPEKTEKPVLTPEQHSAYVDTVVRYFGGTALHESSVPGTDRGTLNFGTLNPQTPEHKTPEIPKTEMQEPAVSSAPMTEPVKKPEPAREPEPVKVPAEPPKPAPVQEEMAETAAVAESADPLKGYSMVGVAFDTYIILQNEKQLLLIDQHAAHERILYEKLMRSIDTEAASQQLLVPQVVHVTPRDAEKIETYSQEIRDAGYVIEPFGGNTYQIRAVPNVMGEPQSREMFLDMVDGLGELQVLTTRQKRRDAILQMACKKAIKGGDRLTEEEIRPLLADMFATGAPPTCPHGRPLVVVLPRAELEKRFRRIND